MNKMQKGFSIMEVLIAIGIISVIGVISSNLLTRTYRTTSDTDLISKLKQNASVASNTMDETIRMADGVVCYGSNGTVNNRIVLRTNKGKYVSYRFVAPVPPTGTPITQNGYIARQESLNPAELPNFCTQAPNPSLEAALTDNNINTGVSVSNGEFQKVSGGSGKDTVTIKFDIGPAGNETGITGIVNVQTTTQVR